ncbi:MAG: peptidase domain-containing ABC transporter [Saccharospirillum sp.]
MLRTKAPVKLKADCLFQLEQAFRAINKSNSATISLSQYIVEDHIASHLLLEKIDSLNGLTCSWIKLEDIVEKPRTGSAWIAVSNEGDTYILNTLPNGSCRLLVFIDSGVEAEAYEGTLEQLTKDLNLSPFAIEVKRINLSAERDTSQSYIWRHFLDQKAIAKVIIGIAMVIALLGVATPLGFQTFTDKILPYSAQSSLIVVVVLLFLAAIATSVFQCFHDYQESVLFAKYQNGLGKEAFTRLLSMNIPFFDTQKVGDLTKLVDQIQEASNFLVRQLLSSVVAVLSLLVVLPFLFFYSPMLSFIVLGIGLLMAATVAISLKPLRKRILQAYTYDASYQSTLIEMVKGMRTIKSLANESHFRHRINTRLETNLYGDFHIARLSHVVRALVNFQSQLITIAVIFFGAQAVFANQMTIGQLIAFNMMAGNVVNPLISLVMTASGWETFKLAKRRLEELEPPAPLALPIDDDAFDLNGPIEFQDVWFSYPKEDSKSAHESDRYVLKGINLTIDANEILGIVGGSGSGKSTLVNLLLGFYKPHRGKITINGYDIELIPPDVLRAHISSVQQTSFLFNTSVLENVHLGRLDSNIEDIQTALDASGSTDFVDNLSHKFLTHLSEDGGNLSGGQRQRLAIARALVRNSDILLFDEATSALDNQTEETIKETIYQACQHKTGIIIAHRLNTLSYCNRIVVMNAGEIEAVGTHDELLAGENSYQAMWEAMLKRDSALDRLALVSESAALANKPQETLQQQEATDAV